MFLNYKKLLIKFVFVFFITIFIKSESCPFLSERFRLIYDELAQQEIDILNTFKKTYPHIPSFEWDEYYRISQKGFVLIKKEKKEYDGALACGKLESDCLSLVDKDYEAFIKQYTQCALERNGIDPEKLKIYHHPVDLVDDFPQFRSSFDLTNEGPFDLGSRPYIFNEKIDNTTILLVNMKSFLTIEFSKELAATLTGIDQVASRIAELYLEKSNFIVSLFKKYNVLDNNNQEAIGCYCRLKRKLSNIHHEHAWIIAAMRSKSVASALISYIEDKSCMPFSQDVDHRRIVSYLYKIKQFHDDLSVPQGIVKTEDSIAENRRPFLVSCISYMKDVYIIKHVLIIGVAFGLVRTAWSIYNRYVSRQKKSKFKSGSLKIKHPTQEAHC